MYVAFTHMHVPLVYNEAEFGHTSKDRGVYGDALHEMDDAVSRIVEAVQRAGVEDNTLVWFLCKCGPRKNMTLKLINVVFVKFSTTVVFGARTE